MAITLKIRKPTKDFKTVLEIDLESSDINEVKAKLHGVVRELVKLADEHGVDLDGCIYQLIDSTTGDLLDESSIRVIWNPTIWFYESNCTLH